LRFIAENPRVWISMRTSPRTRSITNPVDGLVMRSSTLRGLRPRSAYADTIWRKPDGKAIPLAVT